MRKTWPIVLLLTCVLVMSGCAAKSQLSPPVVCPTVPPLPASLRTPLHAEQRLSELLLESGGSVTHGSPR